MQGCRPGGQHGPACKALVVFNVLGPRHGRATPWSSLVLVFTLPSVCLWRVSGSLSLPVCGIFGSTERP